MKTVFLNDTRSAEHVGCALVMEQTLAECHRAGIEVDQLWTTAQCKEPLVNRLDPEAFDCLLINGEGSMHHDRPVAAHLCEAAVWAKNQGKKVVLFNTLWEENDQLNRHLRAFDRIYCRDSASAEAIGRAGVPCQVVPDMIFAATFESAGKSEKSKDGTKNELTIIDSIDRKKSEGLSRFANRYGFPFLHMDRIGYERLKKRLFVRTGWFSAEPDFGVRFVETLRHSQRVLSGRFHGTCLAMVLGIPVISVSSNTQKLETLYRDVGLDDSGVWPRVPKKLKELEDAFAQAEAALPDVRRYVEKAGKEIPAMFDEIAEVFRDPGD